MSSIASVRDPLVHGHCGANMVTSQWLAVSTAPKRAQVNDVCVQDVQQLVEGGRRLIVRLRRIHVRITSPGKHRANHIKASEASNLFLSIAISRPNDDRSAVNVHEDAHPQRAGEQLFGHMRNL